MLLEQSGGHVNILNPESCLEDEQLWQFLQRRTEFPQAWRLDRQWSDGPDSPGWRMVYAFTTTGGLEHAWSLLLQIDMQSSVSAQTKEVMNAWVELLRAGTSAGDFVYRRQALAEVRSPKLTVGFSQSSYTLMTYRVVADTRLQARCDGWAERRRLDDDCGRGNRPENRFVHSCGRLSALRDANRPPGRPVP